MLGVVSYTITPDAAGTVGSNPQRWGGWARAADGSWTGVRYHGNESPDSGYLSFERHRLDGECEGYIKYDLSGSQTITIDFPEIQVTRSATAVPPGTSVRFTASASGFVPATGQWSWEWVTMTGVTPVSVCDGASICDYVPVDSGYMMTLAYGTDDQGYRGQSERVLFTDPACLPYGDNLLDSAIVRRELEDLLVASNAFNMDFSARRERASFVYRNPDGTYRVERVQTQLRVCGGEVDTPYSQLSDPTLVAFLHSHPFNDGDVAPCEDGPKQYPPHAQGGGSPPDYDSMSRQNLLRDILRLPPLRWIVVDKQLIWRMDPTADRYNAAKTATSISRVDLGCHRSF